MLRQSAILLLVLATTTHAKAPVPRFRHQTIDDKIEIGYGVAAADVDGDNKIDILLADKRHFVWYRNPTWEKFVIAENLTKRDNVCLAAQDLDGDGKCELAVGGDWDPNDRENSGAVFYMVAPEDRTQKWEPIRLHAEPTVHRMRWVQGLKGQWELIVVPLHGRGRDDAGVRILRYQMPKDARGEWKTEVLDDSLHATHNFDLLLGEQVVCASREGIFLVPRLHRKEPLGRAAQPAGEVRMAGLLLATVEPMHGHQLVVYAKRKRHVLTDRMSEGHALALADVNGDRNLEVIAGWRGKGGGVVCFTSSDSAFSRWCETVIDDGGMACEDVCLADLDADGKLDIIASGRATKNVKIYWNETGS